ncbi:MAG: PQQ-binding-like beta-propeller repeat protein, partial [Siphonobacter aquaeclarae]|nr:PQQ-binding-like beta-propeller repeat protein [Siphonobacter aquaeclarae]
AGVLYVPSKEIPVYTSLIPKEVSIGSVTGEKLYRQHCSACHGPDRKGNHDGSYPSLLGVGQRLSDAAIAGVLQKGRGMMPSFTHLKEEERKAVIDFLLEKGGKAMVRKSAASLPYQHTGYNRWYDRNGYPVSTPPWGTLTAIDLNTGARKWQVPLGEYPELTRQGVAPTGTDNYGGPLVTAGGLVFIAATRDEQFRAFDARTGKIRWQVALPAAGYASPSTYRYRGKQYILLACGGGKLNTRSGDRYLAYALPD